MIFTSPYEDVEIPAETLYEAIFVNLNEADARRVAIVDGPTGNTTTYGELKAQVDAIAGGLAERGIAPGDVVALHAPNIPAFVAVFHAILRAGATVTTVTALSTAEDIEHQLRDAGARMLFTISALGSQSLPGAAAAGLTNEQVVVLDGAEGYPNLGELLASATTAPKRTFDPEYHLAVLPFSSGTTGAPKGVMLTHRNLVANLVQADAAIALEPDDRVLAVLPFTHIYGLTVLLNLALRKRSRLITLPKFELPEFLRAIQDEKATAVFIAPPIAVALAKHPLVAQYDLSSIDFVLSGAAALDEQLANSVALRLGARILQGYGMTETSPVTHVIPRDRDDLSRGSIGVPVPNTEVRVVDIETGDDIEVPEDGLSEPGEMLIRGPQVMVGYMNNHGATSATIGSDGFLHTGDIVRVDAHGQTFVVDRLKELIKYKGYQVPPAELEALLLTNPLIADAAVVAYPDPEVGELPKAFVVRQGDAELTEQDVLDFVAVHAAPHKKVRLVEFIDAIPKSSSGKILRRELRARDAAAVA
ncbi:AMP-binding protein [Gulosibacter sp. ACHW.36C]|uniref:AMP-binding protein n=1 Tax=Gulosibacter sediminis TaxID=1729695 RepID=A0ABY4MVW8_9MICO|nr:AMP-binding protein [Gulosibacter sediminis]UQN14571.1 AMP-binding protein [Gulosibacter sediminis]